MSKAIPLVVETALAQNPGAVVTDRGVELTHPTGWTELLVSFRGLKSEYFGAEEAPKPAEIAPEAKVDEVVAEKEEEAPKEPEEAPVESAPAPAPVEDAPAPAPKAKPGPKPKAAPAPKG